VLERTVSLWRELAGVERDHHLDFLREPEVGFAWAAWRWAEGDDLDVVLDGTQLAAGDFVRLVKQLVDLAGQVADASPGTELRASARQLVRSLRRGVVAYSSLSD
jgi:ATP-dependent RNA helicase HelY